MTGLLGNRLLGHSGCMFNGHRRTGEDGASASVRTRMDHVMQYLCMYAIMTRSFFAGQT